MSASGWEQSKDTISASRFYPVHDEFKLSDGVVPAALLALPALLIPEVGSSAADQGARIAKIHSAKNIGGELNLNYTIDPDFSPIPVDKIVEWAKELDIETSGFNLTHTHWTVNDADLFEVLYRKQAALGPQPTVFKLSHERDSDLIGVMMPFDAGFKDVYKAIKAGIEKEGSNCERADNLWTDHKIIQTIVTLICQADMIVADCSKRNPNVFYEAGIAHTLGRDVILLAQDIEHDIPFDLRHLSVIKYLHNSEGLKKLTTDLTKRIQDIKRARRKR